MLNYQWSQNFKHARIFYRGVCIADLICLDPLFYFITDHSVKVFRNEFSARSWLAKAFEKAVTERRRAA